LDACFIVRDHNGQPLTYVYFEDEPGRRSAAKLLTKDEARRIAVNIAQAAGATGGKSRFLQAAKASLTLQAATARLMLQAAKPSLTLQAAKARLTAPWSSCHR
jgi:hypothetical protein